MLKHLLYWDSGSCPPADNMAWDELLLDHAAAIGTPLLRCYSWAEPAATFGYSQKYAAVEQMTDLRPLIRRPTGGGLVPHDADWTYSLLFAPDQPWSRLRAPESYQLLHQWILGAFRRFGCAARLASHTAKVTPGHCFAGPDQFDVLLHDRKIAGAAQRRTRSGLLIQGSIQPPTDLDRARWNQAFLETARQTWQTEVQTWTPTDKLQQLSRALAESKYARPEYNRRR